MYGIGLFVRDLNAEFLENRLEPRQSTPNILTNLFDCHYHLNSIQAIQAKVIRKVGGGCELFIVNSETKRMI